MQSSHRKASIAYRYTGSLWSNTCFIPCRRCCRVFDKTSGFYQVQVVMYIKLYHMQLLQHSAVGLLYACVRC